jgi:release factor glutamine methyltransferase
MKAAPRSVGRAVERGARALARRGIDSPRFEAELLLAQATGASRLWIMTHHDARLSEDAVRRFVSLVARRRKRVPMAYLLGRQEFYSIEFEVGPGVLVPRPETELLVEKAIEWTRARSRPCRVLDAGVGSGAIAVALLVNAADARVVAIDRSEEALDYARVNARKAGVAARLTLLRAGLEDLPRLFRPGSFDLIVSNPPYVAADLVRDETAHEPPLALVGVLGDFPNVYRLLARASGLLRRGGAMMLEVGEGQAATVAAVVDETATFARVEVVNDLAGVPRTIVATGAGE